MLTSTFIHVQGIGYITERRIWEMGVRTWDDYLDRHSVLNISDAKKAFILERVKESISSLADDDHTYFSRVLPSREHWRAVGEFGDRIAYLDIETTGCGWEDQITVIGMYDGIEMRQFVRGINLDEFPEAVSESKVLATFFGSGFDIPFIKRTFPDLNFDQLHVDLCFLLKRLGLSGGLKQIEDRLGICRCPETEGLSGFDAVRLWREYRRGSSEALDLLLLYNKEDVINMERLLDFGCAEHARLLGL